MPGRTQLFFVLSKYKEELGRDYRRIVLFLCTETDYERIYSYHILGQEPYYSSDEYGEEEEGSRTRRKNKPVDCFSSRHKGNDENPGKKRTKVLQEAKAISCRSEEPGVSNGACINEAEVHGVSNDIGIYKNGPSGVSSGVPEEFLWEGDFNTEIDEEELIKAATARSLEFQCQSKDETDLETL